MIYFSFLIEKNKMKIPKDIYEYLTNFADDKTVLNMFSVNKKFNDFVFFEKIMTKRYLTLIGFKKKNEKWKEFYVRTIYWVSRLKKNFFFETVPYVYPKIVYQNLKDHNFFNYKTFVLRSSLLSAVRNKDINSIKKLIERGVNISRPISIFLDTNRTLELDFLKFLENIDSKDIDWYKIIEAAKKIKRGDIVSYLESIK
jgi:hypothetical protein